MNAMRQCHPPCPAHICKEMSAAGMCRLSGAAVADLRNGRGNEDAMGNVATTQRAQDLGLTEEEREQITQACRTIHEIMLRHCMVKTNWSPLSGTDAQGRVLVHKFTIGGYVKSYPPGYEAGVLTPDQMKKIVED